MDIIEFRESCLKEKSDIVVQKHLIEGVSYFFEKHIGDERQEFYFKKDLSMSLEVHLRDIVIVGSGKLGFSIKPDKDNPSFYPFKKFDFDVEKEIDSDPSDLDIAIVSSSLFDKQLFEIYNHTNGYTSNYGSSDKKSFAYYILKGWVRPDYIPKGYKISPSIEDIQTKYKQEFGRKINLGIYKSWYFFENYHKNNIHNIQLNLIASI